MNILYQRSAHKINDKKRKERSRNPLSNLAPQELFELQQTPVTQSCYIEYHRVSIE